MGPDGLLEEEVLRAGTCDAALGTEFRVTFASLPFDKMKGVGASTYENYKKKYSKEPTSYALYSVEAGRIAIDAIKRAAADIEKGANPQAKREAVRKAIAGLKNYEGLNGKFSFDENGDTTSETMSGFKVVKADKEPGCAFQFESILE
jgi:branched-chain amino acid transport system substrate-binding protein